MNAEEISQYIFLDDGNPRGDVALAFGTWNSYQESAARAAGLYQSRVVSKIVVTGGPNRHNGKLEGEAIAGELEQLGVPRKDILLERKSTNTLDNVLWAMDTRGRAIYEAEGSRIS